MKKDKKIARIYPFIDGPRYNEPFRIYGFQGENIDHDFTPLIEFDKSEYLEFYKCENRREFKNWKNKISNEICKSLDAVLEIPLKQVTVFKIKYLGEKEFYFV